MKVSVIIPVYRPQSYLWECLDSLRAQTLPAEEWEAILVLNGEEYPYRSQIEAYMTQYSAFHWHLLYVARSGVSNARNMGLQAAQGDYICFLDDDDYISAAYLEALLESTAADVMALSDLRCFKDGEGEFFSDHISGNYQRIKGKGNVSTMEARQYLSGPVAKLIACDKALQERFNPRFANGEDALYIFALSRFYRQYHAASEKAVYYRRVRGNSARQNFRARLKTMFPLMWAYFCIWIKHPWQYNFSLFASRFIAIPKGIWKIYRAIY